jgi:hypothetical protein
MELHSRRPVASNRDEITPISMPISNADEEEPYPEGGLQAWLVVLGTFCTLLPSMGIINTMGILQARVSQHELVGYSEANVGWIFSIHTFIVFFFGAQVGMLCIRFVIMRFIISKPNKQCDRPSF